MTALAKVLYRTTGANVDVEVLKTIAIFCCSGLLLSLVMSMTFGLDLSPGFF
jgi:hypothetical protein